jgi:arginyl-tRNA synthetase
MLMSVAVRAELTKSVEAAFTALGVVAPPVINLEVPARREHGDWSTNAALAAAKAAGRNPRELATQLVEYFTQNPPHHVVNVALAGPGFVNFHLANSWLHDVLVQVVTEGVAYGAADVGKGKSVIVEYVSANPTGPLHAGHARWAAFGDALSRVLAKANYHVQQEFYVNDRGVQIGHYVNSLLARRDGFELPVDGYAGQYVIDWAAEMPKDLTGDDAKSWALNKAHEYQRDTMARMNVRFDTWSSEQAVADRGEVEATLADLVANGKTYVAVQPRATSDRPDSDAPAEGTLPATWLATTECINPKNKKPFDDADRVLVKGDGQYTYFTPDIAYHRNKFSRADMLIDILGPDHHGYVGRMKAAVMCLGHAPTDLEILIGQNVALLRNGEELRMSKRTGDIIELADIIDEVGADVAKLTFLLQSVDTRQTVDLGVIVESKLDNPVHYIHYAHARVYGIGRKAADQGVIRKDLAHVNLAALTDERELDVLRCLASLSDVVSLAAVERAPHKVTTWLRELAGAFQTFYAHCPILRSDVPSDLQQARLWLLEAARIGLAAGLDLLGVSAPERMDELPDIDAELDAVAETTSVGKTF